jgi:hypothetical protein
LINSPCVGARLAPCASLASWTARTLTTPHLAAHGSTSKLEQKVAQTAAQCLPHHVLLLHLCCVSALATCFTACPPIWAPLWPPLNLPCFDSCAVSQLLSHVLPAIHTSPSPCTRTPVLPAHRSGGLHRVMRQQPLQHTSLQRVPRVLWYPSFAWALHPLLCPVPRHGWVLHAPGRTLVLPCPERVGVSPGSATPQHRSTV